MDQSIALLTRQVNPRGDCNEFIKDSFCTINSFLFPWFAAQSRTDVNNATSSEQLVKAKKSHAFLVSTLTQEVRMIACYFLLRILTFTSGKSSSDNDTIISVIITYITNRSNLKLNLKIKWSGCFVNIICLFDSTRERVNIATCGAVDNYQEWQCIWSFKNCCIVPSTPWNGIIAYAAMTWSKNATVPH